MFDQHKRYWAEVNLDTALDNFNIIKSRLNEKTKLCCVVKADGYGHGAVELSKLYERAGADYFAVSNIEEAIELRENDIKLPLLILGYTPPECAKLLSDFDIEQAVFSYTYAKELEKFANAQGVKIKIHLKLDSGMGRIGFSCRDGLTYALDVLKIKSFVPLGVFTHFAVADEGQDGREYTKMQFENFCRGIEYLEEKSGVKFSLKHCANSASIFDYPEFQLDMVRAGIVLYGSKPSGKVECQGIKDVMSLKSVVSMVKEIEKGDCVSYGCTYKAEKKTTVATIPVGYADGFWRSNLDKADFIIKGKKAPMVGRVCMDQLMIDVSHIPDVKMGDEVIIMGECEKERITASDIANRNNTISYEILCAVGKRVPRYYISASSR